MSDASDMELLRDYDWHGSEEAFAELVRRHIDLVYSAAFRYIGTGAQAEEITQAVFIILARKAAGLRPDTVLEGWLYETTRLTALSFLRGERRRQFREQEAYMQSTLNEHADDAVWNQLSPLLEEAVSRLGKQDRNAVLLRFFKEKSVREVATTMRVSEAAAQRRILRALEKLRKFFTRRGVSSTTAIIAGTISANSVQAAPVALAKSVTAVAIAKGATASISTLTLINGALKIMAYKKTLVVITGIGAALLIGVTLSIPAARKAVLSAPEKVVNKIPAFNRHAALLQQMQTVKMSVWPALMKFSEEHNGAFPKSMEELRPYLPPGLPAMDDNHWRITAGNKLAKPKTPEQLTLCEQINQPAGQPRIVLYADGHVEYRK